MTTIIDRVRNEPVLLTALIQSVLALVVSFGLSLSPEQIGGILAVSAAILAIVARSQVTPTRTIDYVEENGYEVRIEGYRGETDDELPLS